MPRSQPTPRHAAAATPWRWAFFGALLGLFIVPVFFAPASWLTSAVNEASAGQVQLIEARGTLWTGSARLVLAGGAGSRDSAALPGRMGWKLRPGWLAMNVHVRADCCTPTPLEARLTPRWGQAKLELTDGASQWPAALLAGLGTPWNTVQADGTLQLVTQGLQLEVAKGRVSMLGRIDLTAANMSSRLSTLKPMGSYRMTLTGGDAAALELSTLEGSLQLTGSGHWVGSRLRFEGVATAVPEHEAALANLLNIIGRRNGARSIITLG